jgi:hypothetical protein
VTERKNERGATSSRQFVVEADPRGRVSLARAGRLAERYLCYALADGRIILQPAAIVSEVELDLLADPEAIRRLDEGRRELDRGDVGPRGWTRIEADEPGRPGTSPESERNDT